MFEKQMNNEEALSRITKYVLERAEGYRVFIDVHEIISCTYDKKPSFKYMAVANLVMGSTKPEFIKTGDNPDEVLSLCLESLKNVTDFVDILSPSESE
jgi:hypothetical protein